MSCFSESDEEDLSSLLAPSIAVKDEVVESSPTGSFFRFNEEIGRGAFKKVYRGLNNDLGCEVAWNVICMRNIPENERDNILEEIKLNNSLNHPNIISYISSWYNSSKDELVFITELVTGGSMRYYLRKKVKKPRLKVIKLWCRGILSGLRYLHNHKPYPIIHRDLKCENLLVMASNGEVKIGDFGLSTLLRSSLATSILGTPEYMAPEVYEGSYDTKVDIYAFGMCVVEMATQTAPYKECTNAASLYKKIISRQPPAALYKIEDPELRKFIELCLGPEWQRPTAGELLKHPFLIIDENDPRTHEPVRLSSPVAVKQTVSDADKIPISLIVQSTNGLQEVSFEYSRSTDTPEAVSEEMVRELELDRAVMYLIAKEIERKVNNASNCPVDLQAFNFSSKEERTVIQLRDTGIH